MRRVGVAIAVFLVELVVLTSPAAPCSMARITTPAESIEDADGAFVGVLVSDADFEVRGTGVDTKYTFLVEWVIKGDIGRRVDVTASKNVGMCGLGRIERGKRVGLVLGQFHGRWGADMGDLFDPDELLTAAPEGVARNLGSNGLAQRMWVRVQTVPLRTPAVVIVLLLGVFAIAFRSDRRRVSAPAGSGQPAH